MSMMLYTWTLKDRRPTIFRTYYVFDIFDEKPTYIMKGPKFLCKWFVLLFCKHKSYDYGTLADLLGFMNDTEYEIWHSDPNSYLTHIER